ncbi:hypothetical protein ACF08N_35500 [Streptomyces sp. NPDC015127]|uniref:hypothetical protein n=1 Tax=Streptomyces sp. NPDC015127 TaxID=3364939 RepID=UPI0036FF721D
MEVLGRVRIPYLDIQAWVREAPSWAPWAVRCPIRRSELEGISAKEHRDDQATLLAAARETPIDETVERARRTYRRARYRWDTRSATQPGPDAVLVTDEERGERIESLHRRRRVLGLGDHRDAQAHRPFVSRNCWN